MASHYERFRSDRAKESAILVVTRMLPRKGVQHFLDALRGVDLGGYEVNIVGDGPYLPTLKEMAREHDVDVHFHGWIDNESPELEDLYKKSSIFVFVSEAENFPIVLLEAMSSGLAIISVNDTGCPEVLGESAFLVPPRDPEQYVSPSPSWYTIGTFGIGWALRQDYGWSGSSGGKR